MDYLTNKRICTSPAHGWFWWLPLPRYTQYRYF